MTGRVLALALLGASAACAPLALVPAPAPAAPRAGVERIALPAPSPEDIARERAMVFGDSAAAVLVDAPVGPRGVEPSWDIDVRTFATNDRVMHFVQLFAGDARDRIARRLSRGTRYSAMIRRKLKAGGIPEDMTYLALVESGYDPDAYSKAAAVGMWQFMSSTARGLGLRVDWWVDERRDPVRSTDAAVRFINFLRKQFGSMYLAAAAYNGGPGRVARGLTRYAGDFDPMSGDSMFFALAGTDALRRETRDYVPQIVAAALIANDPARYGLAIETLPGFSYDSVTVGPATPIAALAAAAGVTVPAVRELNPQLLRGMTPPDEAWTVRVPTGHAAGALERLAALPDVERRAITRVTTRKGQTMAGIARAHDITAQQLGWYNRRVSRRKNGTLVTGQSILVPSAATVAAARDVPDPAIERYPRPARGRSRVVTHVVRSGETLDAIAKRYGMSTSALMRRNRLRGTMLAPGQSLLIRGAGGGSAPRKPVATPAAGTPRGTVRAAPAPPKKKTAAGTSKGTSRR